mmetsp:Transcript_30644/g.27831  ORF Transcript_30644/g.27831 Transcript_30644/m.27831 type:complete len:382 (-) Transcript_30644:3170-4315(-)
MLKYILPLALRSHNIKTLHITSIDNLVTLTLFSIVSNLGLLNLFGKLSSKLSTNLRNKILGSIKVFGTNVADNSFLIVANLLIEFSGQIELSNVSESLADNANNFLGSLLIMCHDKLDSFFPGMLKLISIIREMLISDFQICIDSSDPFSAIFPKFGRVDDFITTHIFRSGFFGQIHVNLVDKLRSMLLGNSHSFSLGATIKIHFNGHFRLLGLDEALLSSSKITLLHEGSTLIQQDSWNTLRIILSGNLEGRNPIFLMLIHINSLIWLASLDEFFLSFFKSIFIFEEEGILEMDISSLMLGVLFSHLEGFLEFFSVNQVFDDSINQVHLEQHLHTSFRAQRFSPFLSELTSFLFRAIYSADSDGIFPQAIVFVHLNSTMP